MGVGDDTLARCERSPLRREDESHEIDAIPGRLTVLNVFTD